MLKRIISALIGAPLLLLFIYLGGWYTAVLVTVLTLLGLREFLLIGEQMKIQPWFVVTYLFAVIWLLGIFINGAEWALALFVFWILIGLGRLALTYPKSSLAETNYNLLAVIYTVILLSHLYLLSQLPNGLKWTYLTILLVWATDIGAYLIGRQFGKHLLAPRISPKKTIEGSVGGMLFCILTALVVWRIVGGESWIVYVALSIVIGVSAQIGDLYESALKRSAGVKDSGKLIPGHGGILDRFDSLIFALPLMYYGVKFLI